ncbi:sigma-54-dependent Fis family transcriptional regulator [Mesorhizobium sp. B2-4-14]|uniref:sigma-54-dependent Fis family transcriptional regulator n=1 Tax=Mesorhizobium sp. B2-4-14 TaxID=2589935 RepID=UPI00112CB440|nr:sigma-54-dependent Fis family transcriptional regulator [Mesorhizobium sp. B2-4-14]TPK99861.1 sigma-54-dependent Fis family transcriptional regulator [Mesorhizobium sp. B2-4-14]
MDRAKDHLAQIESTVQSLSTAEVTARKDWRAESWIRCIGEHKLDPTKPKIVDLSQRELKLERELFDNDLAMACEELEGALAIIQEGGYSAYITNSHGTILAERRSRDNTYHCSTDRVGAVWSEEVGGTNAIGTAIRNLQPTAVLLSDHFFADFTAQACVGAPFFDPDGNLLGVVNFSTRNPAVQESTQKVVFGVAQNVARRLERRYFRDRFAKNAILNLSGNPLAPAMLAVDLDCRLVGASRAARQLLSLNENAFGSRSLWGLFEKSKEVSTLEAIYEKETRLRQIGTAREFEIRGTRPRALGPSSSKPAVSDKKPVPPIRYRPTLSDCVGDDEKMRQSVTLLRRFIGSGLHILLLGETGVGKDTLARALHDDSMRSGGPFVAFNCSAVPESLIDSELFGYATGAFTGANRDGNSGRIVESDGGTLFLDEVGDMPLVLQTRLLRFLETAEVSPLGSGKLRHVDTQVIAATNQDLATAVEQGRFRRDLYHRLAGVVVSIPSLRERKDLDRIIDTIVLQYQGNRRLELTDRARVALRHHNWPGNIRELRNVIQRGVMIADDAKIDVEHLSSGGFFVAPAFDGPEASPRGSDLASPQRAERSDALDKASSFSEGNAKAIIANAERNALEHAIKQSGGNAEDCAFRLGVSRATLYRKLKKHGLELG